MYLPIYGSSSFQRYPNCKTFKSEQPQCPLSVSSVASVLTKQGTLGLMKEFTLGKSHMNVNSVASVLAKQETKGAMKEFTLGKSLMNVNSVASVLTI